MYVYIYIYVYKYMCMYIYIYMGPYIGTLRGGLPKYLDARGTWYVVLVVGLVGLVMGPYRGH